MPLSTYQRKRNILDLIKKQEGSSSSGSPRYLALSTTAPNPDGTNVTEPATDAAGTTATGYKRISMDSNIISGSNFPSQPSYNSVSDIWYIKNQIDMYFYEAKASWGELTHFAVYDASYNGNMLAYGALQSSITPTAGMIPVIRAEQLTISEEQIVNQ